MVRTYHLQSLLGCSAMATPPPRNPRVSLSIRVDEETVHRLRLVVHRVSEQMPSFRISVSDVARLALTAGLPLIEKRYRIKR